jgi:hypothetical protein
MGIRTRTRRAFAVGVAALLALTSITFAVPGAVAAPALGVSGIHSTVPVLVYRTAAYDSAYGRFYDGIISNTESITVSGTWIKIGWAEDPLREDCAWPETDRLDPGDWSTFHFSWPADVPTTWTPEPVAWASPGTNGQFDLSVSGMTGPVVDSGTGMRTWTATVTNSTAVTVSGIDVLGYEAVSGTLLDALFSWCAPESLAPGESAQIQFHGKAASPDVPTPYVRALGTEAPVITLAASTLTPVPGTPVAFRIELRRSDGSLVTGSRTLKIYYSTDQSDWKYVYFDTDTGIVDTTLVPAGPTYYKSKFWGDGELGTAESAVLRVTPAGAPVAPVTPSVVRRSKIFRVGGVLPAVGARPGATVTVQCQRKVGRRWVVRASIRAYPDATGQYAKRISLKQRGSWRIRGYRAGIGYSAYRYLRVK